jgi:hypothetical protein
LRGETFEGEDSLGLSDHQLNPSYHKGSKQLRTYRWVTLNLAFRRILLSLLT